MKNPHHSYLLTARPVRSAFSLIELLTVIAVLAILAGLTAPAIKGLTGANGLTGAQRTVDTFCAGARANSISKGALTAVVVLKSNGADDDANPSAYRVLTALELTQKPDGTALTTADWTRVSKWEKLPSGIIIDNAQSSFLDNPDLAPAPALPDLVYQGQTMKAGTDYSYQIFLPSGRLRYPPTPCNLRLAEGYYTEETPTFTSAANSLNFVFNGATGEVKIVRP